MSSAFVMTTRLIWKRAWLGALLTALVLVTVPMVLPAVLHLLPGAVNENLAQLFRSQLLILGLSWVAFGFLCINAAYQSPLQLTRGLPVSSTRIASWVMWSTVVMVVVPALLINGLVRLLLMNASWPDHDYSVLGPSLFITAFILVAWSAFWSLQTPGFWRLLFWTVAVAGLVSWLVYRYYPEGVGGKLVPWKTVTLAEGITMLAVTGFAWLAGVRSYSLIRCGAAVTSRHWSQMEDWLNGDLLYRHKHTFSTAGSAMQAFARLHWKDSCHPTTLTVMSFGCLTLILNLSGYLYKVAYGLDNPVVGSNPAVCTLIVFLLSSFSLLLTLGYSLGLQDFSSMKGYLAQLPISDRELSQGLIFNLFKSLGLLIFWVYFVGFGVSYLIVVCHQGLEVLQQDWNWIQQQEFNENMILMPLTTLLLVWALISNGLALIWTGHTKFIGNVFFLGAVLFYLTFFVAMHTPQTLVPVFTQFWMLLIIGLIWTVTFLTYCAAVRRALVTQRTVLLVILFCLITLPYSWTYWDALSLLELCFVSTLLLLPVLPFATIPLAVYWNRHR
ncbi:hypothetical protein Pan153_59840 [Gimesia panareensis]|uniref:Uncharacterized protein n=1 Tax=Gimesia panareensis TaxID=2527978 RepID=A0A518FYC7_9PLAN|nr:hypothetical protein [Gimesia panareensis]QDV21296.1 hypothetical protein Pan153_59840 [Gimesia panareensis]